jgi:hypothetical protein
MMETKEEIRPWALYEPDELARIIAADGAKPWHRQTIRWDANG